MPGRPRTPAASLTMTRLDVQTSKLQERTGQQTSHAAGGHTPCAQALHRQRSHWLHATMAHSARRDELVSLTAAIDQICELHADCCTPNMAEQAHRNEPVVLHSHKWHAKDADSDMAGPAHRDDLVVLLAAIDHAHGADRPGAHRGQRRHGALHQHEDVLHGARTWTAV